MMVSNKAITYETWLPVFPGFYNTCFDVSDLILEYIEESGFWGDFGCDNMNEVYSKLMWDKSYAMVAAHVTRVVARELRYYVSEMCMQELRSPREYNFSNDSVNIATMIRHDRLRKTLISHEKELSLYLKEAYTSWDGFMSFYDHDVETWRHEYTDDWSDWSGDKHYLGAMLGFVLRVVKGVDENELYTLCDHDVIWAIMYEHLYVW